MTVAFEDHAFADYVDALVDQGRRPQEFARIWIHTHPGSSPLPSSTDEETFTRCFGGADWAIMFIVARGGRTYCRLRVGTYPAVNLRLSVELEFSRPFLGAAHEVWEAEYLQYVTSDWRAFDFASGSATDRLALTDFRTAAYWPEEFYFHESTGIDREAADG